MSSVELKYQKRAWHKMSAKIYSVKDVGYNNVEIVVYKGKRKIRFKCFTEVKHDALKLPPHKKINLWFKVESKEYNDKWYNDLWLMHFEEPKVKKATSPVNTLSSQRGGLDIFAQKFGNADFE